MDLPQPPQTPAGQAGAAVGIAAAILGLGYVAAPPARRLVARVRARLAARARKTPRSPTGVGQPIAKENTLPPARYRPQPYQFGSRGSGETIELVARQARTTAAAIRSANGLGAGRQPAAGALLRIPTGAAVGQVSQTRAATAR